jgi:tetratricopeptide (TPR) repeat protein
MQNDTLEMILGLQERSLVHTVNVSDERSARFHLLESFREYAEARLSQEERTELARLHAHFFLEAGATRIPNSGSVLSGVPPPPDLGNLRAATSYYYNQNDFDRAVNMLYDRCQFMADGAWTYERDMIARLGSMRESIGLTPLAKIKLMFMVGKTCVFASRYEEAYSIYQEALEIAKQIGDDRQIVRLCQALGNCAGYSLGTKEALKWFEQVLTHATSHDLLPEQEAAYLGIGTCQWQLGDMAAAEAAFQRAAIVSPQWRNGETFWLVIYNLARIYQDTGRLNESMVLTGDTMRITKRIGELFGIGLSYFLVSRYHWIKGDLQSALANNYESLQYKRRTAFLYWIANGIALHAVLLSELGESETAVTLFGAVNRHGQLESAYHQEHIEALEGLRNTMPLQTFERLWAHGLAMDIYEAYELAVKYRGIG